MTLSDNAKKKLVGAFITIVMLSSVAGFAFLRNPQTQTGNNHTGNQQGLQSNIVFRELTGQETIAVLQAGLVIYRYRFPQKCKECQNNAKILQSFATAYPRSLVVQLLQQNTTPTLTFIGSTGRIQELNMTISEEALLDHLCTAGSLRPKDCVLRNIGNPVN